MKVFFGGKKLILRFVETQILHIGKLDYQFQHGIVELVGFIQTLFQFFFCRCEGHGFFRHHVGVQHLHDFCSYQDSINHLCIEIFCKVILNWVGNQIKF